jgi:pimeloyl-ACP methyl ester carboxylesterase
LSAAGFRCLRFDMAGLGDSVANDVAAENDPYPPAASGVIASAMAAVRDRRTTMSFVTMGLCSGAHASFHAALDLPDEPIVECVLINPLTFYYKRGAPLDLTDTNHYYEWQRYMRSMRSLEGWGKLLREDVHVADITRNVAERVRDIAVMRVRSLRRASTANGNSSDHGDDLARDVATIAESGRKLTFVFSRFDPGYDLLMINAGRTVKRLRKRGLVTVWRVDDANHTFEAKRSRSEMIGLVTDHLTKRYFG